VIGIDATDYTEEVLPSSLALYCSNPTFGNIEFVYKLLPYTTIKANGNTLKVRPGLSYIENAPLSGYEEIFQEYALRSRIEENIKNIYKDRFIEVSGITNDAFAETLPETLQFIHSKPEISQVIDGKRMLWLEMEFPALFTADIIENFFFSLNAFPVYNRAWKTKEGSSDMMGNNIPLSTEFGEHFLYVDEVVDGSGNKYDEIPFVGNGNMQKGLYTLRYGGMERFDERDALDMIDHVLELTRDEVAAFGVMKKDIVVNALRNMTSEMKQLVRNTGNTKQSIKQDVNYVIIEPVNEKGNFRAAYWVTNGLLANNIRANTMFSQNRVSSSTIARQLVLLTDTGGGNEEQKGTNAIQAYKYALVTRDKIITTEDIKSFCRLVLKGNLKEIEVKRGVTISDKPKEGFIKTIEVEIAPKSYAAYGKRYWDNQAASLKKQIVARAIDGVEYIVRIINKDEK
jgi:hypothetical protein